ncbi:MAG: DUF1566 domain-containing protein [Minicystis sp.]
MKHVRKAQRVIVLLAVAAAAVTARRVAADAPPGRYTLPGDGTVLDTKTGLAWQQAVSGPSYTWADAGGYCQNLVLAGSGWRLPSMKELQTIVDESKLNPAIDGSAFPSTPVDFFWTSSPLAGTPSLTWYVNFDIGYTSFEVVSNAFRVRCVR